MTATAMALLGYIIWTLLLLFVLAGYRTMQAQTKREGGLKFASDGSDVPEFGYRLTRAQANCSESFAIIGGALLFSLATDQTGFTDGLALILLAARIGQSLVHMASISNLAIQLRFALFLVQIGIVIYWLFGFFTA